MPPPYVLAMRPTSTCYGLLPPVPSPSIHVLNSPFGKDKKSKRCMNRNIQNDQVYGFRTTKGGVFFTRNP